MDTEVLKSSHIKIGGNMQITPVEWNLDYYSYLVTSAYPI